MLILLFYVFLSKITEIMLPIMILCSSEGNLAIPGLKLTFMVMIRNVFFYINVKQPGKKPRNMGGKFKICNSFSALL